MPITKQKKTELVEALKKQLVKAQSVVFVNFHGLNVADATTLRRDLRAKGVGFKVIKKTLLRLALGASSWEGELPELEGEVAVAYGEDSLSPAKGVYDFARGAKDSLKIIGGVFEGKYVGAEMMLQVATIPGRDELYGRFLYLLNSPVQGLAIALDQIAAAKN
ncbi:MAG: 50S ribosomal protein L10 [Patescibacteria group bacterium]|nr:50S ribosomal protein L10 [Patescibacteria group bacterium]